MKLKNSYKEKLYLLKDSQGGESRYDTSLEMAVGIAHAQNRNPNFGTGGIIKIYPIVKETKVFVGRCIAIVKE